MIDRWDALIGQQRVARWMGNAIGQQRLGGSLLFVGPSGVGKTTVAELLARTLLCRRSPPAAMQPCGVCEDCRQVTAGTHPDLVQVRKPEDRSSLPLDLLIGPPEARMQEGFCRDVRLRPVHGNRRVAILHDADFLNEEGANCLLKTLEEPPPHALIVLIGTSEQRQLPTIRSRCQIIRFASPSLGEAVELLRTAHGVTVAETMIAEALEAAGGDVHAALRLLEPESETFRDSLGKQLSSDAPDPVALSRLINGQVEAAGKEASQRRAAMRDIFSLAIQHYRRELRRGAGMGVVSPPNLRRLDRSLRAIREVDRNANQSTLIECYAADIAAAVTGDRGAVG